MYSTVVKRNPPISPSMPGPSRGMQGETPQETTHGPSKREKATVFSLRNPKQSTTSEKKRLKPDSESNSDDKPIKHPKPGTSTSVPPVSTTSQETPSESESQKTTQSTLPSPVPARKAALTAAHKLSSPDDPEDLMDHSQIIKTKSRSSSKQRKKS